MKKILYGCSILLASSCANFGLETVDGVERVKISQKKYVKPQFYIKKYKPTKAKRSIASVGEDINLSNKKVYFLSLWKQYKQFNTITGVSEPIKFCPQFHDDLLTFKDQLKVKRKSQFNIDFKDVVLNSSTISSYPVLALPYKGTDLYSYLKVKNWNDSKEHAIAAVDQHRKKLKSEINTMCDYGNSNDYYIFENMISYYRSNEGFIYSYKALPSALKVAPVSNIFLLNSMNQASLSVFESNLLSKMNIPWFKNYLYEVSLIRNNKDKRFVLKD